MALYKSSYRNLLPGRRGMIEGGLGPLIRPFDFDLGSLTFLAGMAKRAGLRFAAAPIVQGKWDGTGTPDLLTSYLPNIIFDNFSDGGDGNQGTISFWITPEWGGGDGVQHGLFEGYGLDIRKETYGDLRVIFYNDGAYTPMGVDITAWTAGTTYHVAIRWNVNKSLDGTNYACISVNGSHTFGITSAMTAASGATGYIGGYYGNANSIIEGLRIDRRVWYEDTSGTGEPYYFDANGYIDEIAFAYDAGAGADPALVEASWDGCMCLPTDSAVGALTTGNGNAWSHPHASALLNNTWLEDGFGPNQQDYVSFNGSSTLINCGSAAALDDLPAGGNIITVAGWFKNSSAGANGRLVNKLSAGTNGWNIFKTTNEQVRINVQCATTDASATSGTDRLLPDDDKWHYIAATYNDTTKEAEISVDGRWSTGATITGVGAYQSDAAGDLVIGRAANYGGEYFSGGAGHVSIWSDDHHTAGTDFIPPRTKPGAGGALVESWGLDDGTGATAAATVTSPGNDGTITDGTWTEKWEFTGTPLELTSLEYNGTDTEMIVTDAAAIRDIFTADATVDVYYSCDDDNAQGHILNKSTIGQGWYISCFNATTVRCRIIHNTNDVILDIPVTPDGRWHHIRIRYLNGTLTGYAYLDGVLVDTDAGVGAYQTDNGIDLGVGVIATGTVNHFEGRMGRVRFSDVDRGGGDAFLPNSRVNPPGVDGNTLFQLDMDDGAGGQADDTSGNANHGAITDGEWLNTFAQEYDALGARTYAWGYSIGSDDAGDGVEQHIGTVPGDDWVLRIPVRYEDASAQARILVYDETNVAAISTFDGPPLTGVHDGGDDVAAMTDTGNFFPASLVDGIIYNVTDGSSGTITAVGGTNQDTITATLSGGTGDDWDDGDVYMIIPPPNWVWCEPFCVEIPAGCLETSVQLLNAAGDGVLLWQQAEVQESLISNGSLEAGAGNPWIPTDWINSGLGVGECLQDAVEMHSGSSCTEFVAANAGSYYQVVDAGDAGGYFATGGWMRESAGEIRLRSGINWAFQSTVSDRINVEASSDVWRHYSAVGRQLAGGGVWYYPIGYTNGSGRHDDIYAFALDDVSLTVTPASEANSLEGTGIRIDGRDQATQVPVVGILQATQGWIRFRWRPRHSAAQAVAFGETGTTDIFDGRAPIANTIQLYWAAANTVQLIIDDGGILGIVWDATGLVVADTEYLVEIRYYPARADLLIDGVVVATGAGGIDFGADIITLANYGHNNVNADQTGAVFSAP